MAEGVGFEPTREQNPLPVFKTGALNHSATLPCLKYQPVRPLAERTFGESATHLLPLLCPYYAFPRFAKAALIASAALPSGCGTSARIS